MPKILKATQFGNPILRTRTKRLTRDEIKSETIQTLIENMQYTLLKKKHGVGLAAPQVGADVALSVIGIKPTPNRPSLTPFDTVIINPEITETYGNRKAMWEGCISSGLGNNSLFAQVPRYKKIKLKWIDQYCIEHEETLEGFVAHVAQHETDHLNGILFVDRVKDTTTYMTAGEYRKHIVHKKS
jgi:peptide deformylase